MFGAVPLLGSFWIIVVFPLVIQSGTCASCRHLFISSASQSWMEVNFLNQNPFSSLTSFLVFFWVVRCVFPLWGLPRVILTLLSYRLSVQPFRYDFSVAIFSSKIWLLVCFCVMLSQLLIEFSFVVLECPVLSVLFLPFVDISLISLLSPELSGLFPQVVLLFFLVFYFAFCSHIFQDLSVLPFWPVFVVIFLSGFPVEFPILVLTVSSCFLKGPQFSHTLISPLHRKFI